MDIDNPQYQRMGKPIGASINRRNGNSKSALLFFNRQTGVRSCDVKDITNAGARIRAHDMAVLPLTFELTFNNFRTVRKCQLIWRDGDFLGVAFQN
jgi:hypothetical protein